MAITLAEGLRPAAALPQDFAASALAGRAWVPSQGGPCVVAVREAGVFDITAWFATMRDLCEAPAPAAALRNAAGTRLGSVEEILANTNPDTRDAAKPWFLAPVDLQAVKAAGVTFVLSMLERVIEERARGDLAAAAAIREEVRRLVGDDLSRLEPGSPQAQALKSVLIEQGAWSQYLEVGIGPDAEVFTKAQPLSSVGTGMDAGLSAISAWNNPEPELVLAVSSRGVIVGATLGNDVNLRDVEGRSALLLPKAKDNTASCSIGPFLRFFEDGFSLDDLKAASISIHVAGDDGYGLDAAYPIGDISRAPEDIVAQTIGRDHQYPDGFVLFLGTMFAPIDDRDAPGLGFTHKIGDRVAVSTPRLGTLINRMKLAQDCPPWDFGLADLMRSLARRGHLGRAEGTMEA
jgi:fumarylacetoacetate (FAA) hydrolase family protein